MAMLKEFVDALTEEDIGDLFEKPSKDTLDKIEDIWPILNHYVRGKFLSLWEFFIILKRQDVKCGICKKELLPNTTNHYHTTINRCQATGKVRGLLCNQCNGRINAIDSKLTAEVVEFLNLNHKVQPSSFATSKSYTTNPVVKKSPVDLRKKISESDMQLIINETKSGVSISTIAKKWKVSNTYIYKLRHKR